MFGLSLWELAFVLLLALIVVGPKKMPEIARTIANLVREFQRAALDLKANIDDVVHEETPRIIAPSSSATQETVARGDNKPAESAQTPAIDETEKAKTDG